MSTTSTIRFTNASRASALLLIWILVSTISTYSLAATRSFHQRIINGTEATAAAEWMVSIGFAGTSPRRTHMCGGVLINSNTVLTAAHCVTDYYDDPSVLQVTAGRRILDGHDGVVVKVVGAIIHPDYNEATSDNDIAIMRLAKEIPALEYAKLPTSDLYQPGTIAKIFGWGVTDPDATQVSTHLREASVPMMDDAQCSESLGKEFHNHTMFCAGTLASRAGARDGVDTCQGDSGGPIGIYTDSGFTVIGVTSWGISCGGERYWGVYTRLDRYVGWILSSPVIAPYNIRRPRALGMTHVGHSLVCSAGVWGADGDASIRYRWISSKYRKVSQKRRYRIVHRDVGTTLRCEVRKINRAGYNYAQSKPVGPIQ